MCVRMHTPLYLSIYTSIYLYINIYIYIHMYMYVCIYIKYIYTKQHNYIYKFKYIYIHACIHAHIYTHILYKSCRKPCSMQAFGLPYLAKWEERSFFSSVSLWLSLLIISILAMASPCFRVAYGIACGVKLLCSILHYMMLQHNIDIMK